MTQPAHKLRFGLLSVTIWKNRNEKGNGYWYSVTPSRSYQKDDEWKESDSYGSDDLLVLAKLLDQAHSWIAQLQQAEAIARKAREAAGSTQD